MNSVDEFGIDYAAEQLRRSRHLLRKPIKFFYIRNILRDVIGKTIDFGCGAGQLLACLPAGSVGLEVIPHLVEALRKIGLNAQRYDTADDFLFEDIVCGHYRTFVMAHVLEHFKAADNMLRRILHSCFRLGIERAIIVIRGAKGFQSDKTHKTFVAGRYQIEHGLLNCEGYTVSEASYFPVDVESVGDHFVFHEFKLIYDRICIRP